MPHYKTNIEIINPEGVREHCNKRSDLLDAISGIIIPDVEKASASAGVNIAPNDGADGVAVDISVSEEEYEHNLDLGAMIDHLPAKWNGTKIDGADGVAYMMSCSPSGFWFTR